MIQKYDKDSFGKIREEYSDIDIDYLDTDLTPRQHDWQRGTMECVHL